MIISNCCIQISISHKSLNCGQLSSRILMPRRSTRVARVGRARLGARGAVSNWPWTSRACVRRVRHPSVRTPYIHKSARFSPQSTQHSQEGRISRARVLTIILSFSRSTVAPLNASHERDTRPRARHRHSSSHGTQVCGVWCVVAQQLTKHVHLTFVSRQVIVIQFVLGRQLAKVSGAHRRHYTRARAAAAAPTPAG